jgi:4-hydroxybenzoate polyprenyltransferase
VFARWPRWARWVLWLLLAWVVLFAALYFLGQVNTEEVEGAVRSRV